MTTCRQVTALCLTTTDVIRHCHLDGAFNWVSPMGRAVAGTRSRYISLLEQDTRFHALAGHASATSVTSCQTSSRTYVELVDVHNVHTGRCDTDTCGDLILLAPAPTTLAYQPAVPE
eukprot:jgi/Chrzof1/6552/Cz19g00240.t1